MFVSSRFFSAGLWGSVSHVVYVGDVSHGQNKGERFDVTMAIVRGQPHTAAVRRIDERGFLVSVTGPDHVEEMDD